MSSGAESLRASDASCALVIADVVGGTSQDTIITRNCDQSADEGFVWHFRWLPGMPTSTLSVAIDWTGYGANAGSGGDTCWSISLGCHDNVDSVFDSTMTYGTATASCLTSTLLLTYDTSTFSVAAPSTAATGRFCSLRVIRDADNGTDDMNGDAVVRSGEISW